MIKKRKGYQPAMTSEHTLYNKVLGQKHKLSDIIIMIIKLRHFRKELFVQLHCIEYNREMQIDIICTIVQWRISATFSKGVKGGIL